MKILLVYPRYGYHNRGGFQEPLGILYVMGALERAGHDVTFLDLSFTDRLPDLAGHLDGVAMVGLSSSTALYGRALETLRAVKSVDPGIGVVLGGPHATAMPESCVMDGFDAAVIGEGELTAPRLAEAFANGGLHGDVPGIAYKSGGKVKVNAPAPFIGDLDGIPPPDRTKLDYDAYFKGGLGQVGVVAMRGCPYRCAYCKPMQEKLFGKKIRRRSAANVAVEVDGIARGIYDRILFRDDAFSTHSAEWFRELGGRFREMNTPLWGWACQGRVDQLNPERLDAMIGAGLRMMAFGVESGSQRILDYYRKGITPEQTIRAFDMCRERGVATHAFIMIGAPIETWEDVEATIGLLERIRPNSVSPSVTTPAPGTELYDRVVGEGLFNIDDWADADYMANERPIALPHLTLEQVCRARDIMTGLGIGYGE